ncbi:hypothetical protein A1359_02890 [Methylomonas lenta]|uniref:Winged helix-turn-helix domain-containing protein n=1 Tax=Methylomonas lenta TaxID=980561 RepID=A0A177NR21_9GAMM|nr:winged helix-turn-helix domain-containing protein [Methylomonas lenta]OAI20425.1 hypothetical protein A1359_02890 [Methylomonas lenta]
MKQSKTTSEKPVTATAVEQSVAPKISKATPKKTSSAKPAQKQAEAKAEQPVVTDATPKKPTPKPRTPAKVEGVTSKSGAAAANLPIAERVGLTAGSIWHYLSENGATPVSKLLAALSEEEKVIQRSIGWLAQEDKIHIDTANRVETIMLKA